MTSATDIKREVPFAASEGQYNVAIFSISLSIAFGFIVFLSQEFWAFAILNVVFSFTLLHLFLRNVRLVRNRAEKSNPAFLVSYSRTDETIKADIIFETARITFFSILFDAASKGKSVEVLITGLMTREPYALRFFVVTGAIILGLIYCWLSVYKTEGERERERYASIIPRE